MIRSKVQKSLLNELSMLTPWETGVEDTCINKYCSDYASKANAFNEIRREKNLPKINQKKRAASHCHTHTKLDAITNAQKINENRIRFKSQVDNYQTFHTLSQHKTDRLQKKKMDNRVPLQQLNVKNFIIEGGQTAVNPKEKQVKRRDCSYVMKQKFAQFRRSTKLIDQNKQNSQGKVIRYQF